MKFWIASAAWDRSRSASVGKMLGQLSGADVEVVVSERPEHARVWAQRLWARCAEYGGDSICLNDDVILHPDFARICKAICEAMPDEIVSMHTNIPAAVAAAAAGHHLTRCYWLTGPCYRLTQAHASDLVDFWSELPWSYASRVNEDVVGILWAWSEQRPIYATIPSPCLHDTLIASSLGYDGHDNRCPTVGWWTHTPPGADLTSPDYWRPTGNEPTVENPWMPATKMETIRRCIREGIHLCSMCIARPGLTGGNDCWICKECLMSCVTAAIRAVP